MKTRKAKKPSDAKKALAQLPKEDENEEIDVGYRCVIVTVGEN